MGQKLRVYTTLDNNTCKKVDELISDKKLHFDSRSHFIRAAVLDAIEKYSVKTVVQY